jgi:hypothetical protein
MKYSFAVTGACALSIVFLVAIASDAITPQWFGISPACAAGDDCTPKDGDKDRCECWCSGYADQKAGLKEDDPANDRANSCSMRMHKQEYHDGFVAARDGEAKKCPYKK